MMNSMVTGGTIGGAVSPLGVGIQTPLYVQLPLCISDSGHRFTIGMYHKDRAVCERCGLIRKGAS